MNMAVLLLITTSLTASDIAVHTPVEVEAGRLLLVRLFDQYGRGLARIAENYERAWNNAHRYADEAHALNSSAHQVYLQRLGENVARAAELWEENLRFLRGLLSPIYPTVLRESRALQRFDEGSHKLTSASPDQYGTGEQILLHILRDWSAEGAANRRCIYDPIIIELIKHRANRTAAASAYRILIPGGGAGRLAVECAQLSDVVVVMNEQAYGMVAAAFGMTKVLCRGHMGAPFASEGTTIYPLLHAASNVFAAEDRYFAATLRLGDEESLLCPSQLIIEHSDFLEGTSGEYDAVSGEYDAVVTCFFIDAVTDITRLVARIAGLLSRGGLWINFGPLRYHDPKATFLALDEIVSLAEAFGLQLVSRRSVECAYAPSASSMASDEHYRSALFAAVKTQPES
jgi:hypothetical protein